ncbi:RluA family pseudouridine synthase [Flavobacteriaceae bacterium Ap0902]|nr:RluA family pseudouridine synthase [Flavobacteriaceae bacterium Ap0902]
MNIVARHIVEEEVNRKRFQEFGVGLFPQLTTKSALKKAIKRNQILINHRPATTAHYVEKGDVIELLEIEKPKGKTYILDLKVLYEDDYLAVILKPAGISVSGNKFATIANALEQNLKSSTQIDATAPHPVHRLDYPTSGLLAIGKTRQTRQLLHEMFEHKEVMKIYHAVCVRRFMMKEGVITEPLDEKEAVTRYKVIQSEISEKFEALNLVELSPETGRTHQLRRHLLHLGNPIMGDQKYYIEGFKHQGYGLYLHATQLRFYHPITTQQIIVKSELPKKFKRLFNPI